MGKLQRDRGASTEREIATYLGDHLGVSAAALDSRVFPGTTSALRLDLLRG